MARWTEEYPTETLPPIDDQRFAKVLQFTVLGKASVSSPMTPLPTVRFGAPPKNQKRNWSAVGIESGLKVTIDRLDHELGGREFLVGPNLTLADISVATALRIWTRGLACITVYARPSACETPVFIKGQVEGREAHK